MGYAPLDYLESSRGDIPEEFSSRNGHIWEDYYPAVLQRIFGMDAAGASAMEKKELFEYVLRRDFLLKGHNLKKEHAKWDRNLKKLIPDMASLFGYKDDTAVQYVVSDLRDMIVAALIIDEWVKDKQVLRPDRTFGKYLCDTDKLEITADLFKNLPFSTFYIDLECCNRAGEYGDALGIFVHVMPLETDNETALTLYILRPGNITVSQYLNFDMERCPEKLVTSTMEDEHTIETVPLAVKRKNAPAETKVNPRLMTILVLQLISYMKTPKPDIVPAPEMKSTYRPKAEIKNKYSEIYKQDVGIRIGKAINGHIEAMEKARKDQEKEALSKGRKPPVPHFRRAHWHRYWTGKGRTTCELRWIEPVFVCGSYSSDSHTDVTIHNVHR